MFRKNRDEHTRTEEAFFRPFLTRRQRAGSEPRRFYRKIWDHKLCAAALEQMRSIARIDTQVHLDQTRDEFEKGQEPQDAQ